MAGAARPNYEVGQEAEYVLLASVGGSGKASGLFDGKTPLAWNTDEVFYFNSGGGASVDVDFSSKFVIHRYYSWHNNNNQRLKIMRHDGEGYNEDFTHLHLSVKNQTPSTWAPFTEVLEPGQYRFYLDPTDTYMSGRIDGEWYVEFKESSRKYLFKDGEEIKFLKKGDGGNIVQGMTSNTTPSPVSITTVPEFSEAWKWFDGVSSNITSGTKYLDMVLDLGEGNEARIDTILMTSNSSTKKPKVIDISGSNNSIDYELIYQHSSNNRDSTDILLNVNGVQYFRYYRINIESIIDSYWTLTLSQIKISGEYDAKWQTLDQTSLTKETFELHAMSDLSFINNNELSKLSSQKVELLCWTDEMTPSGQLVTIGMTGYALLVGTNNIVVDSAEKINLYVNQAAGAVIRIAVSSDEGITWKGKSSLSLSDIDLVKANGFTLEELNALTKEQLATLFPNGTARFAFYLEQENLTDVVEIESLSIGEKVYTTSPTATDLSLIYEVFQEEKPTLYASRDDGVSWKEISQDEMASLSEQTEGNSLRVKAVLKNGQEIYAMSYAWS